MPQTLHFGLVLLPTFQWLDGAGSADFINNHSHEFIGKANAPKHILDKAPHMKWHYISSDLKPVHASSGPALIPTTTIEKCPELDYIIVPGPDLDFKLSEAWIRFFRERYADPKVKAILTVCTGSIAVAQSGILDGLKVCSNKEALLQLHQAGKVDKKVKWVKDRRWIVDGKIWSSAGITTGIALAAEFSRKHFDREVVDLALKIAEYTPLAAQPDPFVDILDGIDLSS
ncbi:hypothetical protein D9613_006527 [Agrocybe pediades]|uniref:DJ-1/PfpI domain-containing protein n=1 Tax=Agrocybe pediades TaxID=84607 RepID=A0A8H4QH92_9AGAR|nr:hypothetical protein D9613_006527 [Agrocybe pediades]